MVPGWDEGMRPAAGYALWHLQRGYTEAEVYSMMLTKAKWPPLPPDQTRIALEQALVNKRISDRFGPDRRTGRLSYGFAKKPKRNVQVGVRVIMWVKHPDGVVEEVSVTVNTTPDMFVSTIIRKAIEFYNSGAMSARGRGTQPGVVLNKAESTAEKVDTPYDPYIYQVLEQPHESPALTL